MLGFDARAQHTAASIALLPSICARADYAKIPAKLYIHEESASTVAARRLRHHTLLSRAAGACRGAFMFVTNAQAVMRPLLIHFTVASYFAFNNTSRRLPLWPIDRQPFSPDFIKLEQ